MTRPRAAYETAHAALLAERTPGGFWEGELSSSALATAVAVIALHLADADKHRRLIDNGIWWLNKNHNRGGGWGDTTKSVSNISTTMLVRSAFGLVQKLHDNPGGWTIANDYLDRHAGTTPAARAEAIRDRYGKDRTFSVPILMAAAIAGLVPWREVPRLPFELACLPQSWYRFVKLPVVSYALPALVAIGQCVHSRRGTWNPVTGVLRRLARGPSLKVLRGIQPPGGGYLEATPLTAFVVMALLAAGRGKTGAGREVVDACVDFLVRSVRPDGSWPIDTNLSVWLTTLSVNALAGADDLGSLPGKPELLDWLLAQQSRGRHPFTGAAPGAWGWSHCPGSVPDCDDTPGAILAVAALGGNADAETAGRTWVRDLQNRDGGFPTFCRGWGALPFDRSGADITAHALRAVGVPNPRAFAYLAKQQRPDGSWLPLWFGNQHAANDENPVYGTARVLAAYRDLGLAASPEYRRGIGYLLSVQNKDGGWGGAAGCESTVEETAVAVEALCDLTPESNTAAPRGVEWLTAAVESGRFRDPNPIGFYFAKLWYFEKLYPLIFTVAALGRATRRQGVIS